MYNTQSIKIFLYSDIIINIRKQFKIYGTPDKPLFLAKDVAEWIEHSNSRMMLKTVEDTEKVCVNNPYALKGQ